MATFSVENSPVISRYYRARKRRESVNNCRVISPDSGEVLAEVDITLGSARQARRVPMWVSWAFALGARVEVNTKRGGWSPRVLKRGMDGSWYTRVP